MCFKRTNTQGWVVLDGALDEALWVTPTKRGQKPLDYKKFISKMYFLRFLVAVEENLDDFEAVFDSYRRTMTGERQQMVIAQEHREALLEGKKNQSKIGKQKFKSE